jgi:hypothetical protein
MLCSRSFRRSESLRFLAQLATLVDESFSFITEVAGFDYFAQKNGFLPFVAALVTKLA